MGNNVLNILDRVVSFLILLVMIALIVLMLACLGKGLLNLLPLFSGHQEIPVDQILHGLAVMLIFVKAYKILASYYLSHHINIKFLVEIAIIASTVEVLFNANHMPFPSLVVLAVFGISNLLIYLFFGEKFKQLDHE